MSDRSHIEWTDATWNPVTGCTKVSPGCDHCYAETLAERFRGTPGHYFENGFDVQLRPEKLDQPIRWRRPRRVFVNSMSDLFHQEIPHQYIAQVFAVMALAPQHTFQVLTKRHARMRSLLSSDEFWGEVHNARAVIGLDHKAPMTHPMPWPLPNVWLGVSVEDQQWADIRIPALLRTPAAVRFISAEPLLGPIDLATGFLLNELDWVIVGGESGRGARVMQLDWARALRDQCTDSQTPFLFKQWGEWAPNGIGAGVLGNQRDRYGEVVGDSVFEQIEWRRVYRRVGKRTAGRELDGRSWDQYPGGDS